MMLPFVVSRTIRAVAATKLSNDYPRLYSNKNFKNVSEILDSVILNSSGQICRESRLKLQDTILV